jgi:hypothetical protein
MNPSEPFEGIGIIGRVLWVACLRRIKIPCGSHQFRNWSIILGEKFDFVLG